MLAECNQKIEQDTNESKLSRAEWNAAQPTTRKKSNNTTEGINQSYQHCRFKQKNDIWYISSFVHPSRSSPQCRYMSSAVIWAVQSIKF